MQTKKEFNFVIDFDPGALQFRKNTAELHLIKKPSCYKPSIISFKLQFTIPAIVNSTV